MSAFEQYYILLELRIAQRHYNPRMSDGFLDREEVEELMGSIGNSSDSEFFSDDEGEGDEEDYNVSLDSENTAAEATEENENMNDQDPEDFETDNELMRTYSEQMR